MEYQKEVFALEGQEREEKKFQYPIVVQLLNSYIVPEKSNPFLFKSSTFYLVPILYL